MEKILTISLEEYDELRNNSKILSTNLNENEVVVTKVPYIFSFEHDYQYSIHTKDEIISELNETINFQKHQIEKLNKELIEIKFRKRFFLIKSW